MPFTADCAEAQQKMYNISGGDAVFKNIAEATVELNNACGAFNTEVRPLSSSAQLANKKEKRGAKCANRVRHHLE
jgi:hypothetical protein